MNVRPPRNTTVHPNPAGENTASPSHIPSSQQTMERKAPMKGNPKPIPSTMGYVGKRIK